MQETLFIKLRSAYILFRKCSYFICAVFCVLLSSCSHTHQDHPDYFETVRQKSVELRADGNIKRSIHYLDSVYAAFPDPGIGDLYLRYYDLCDCYFFEGNDPATALLYADSMVLCFNGHETEKRYLSQYISAIIRKGEVLSKLKRYSKSYRCFFSAKNLAKEANQDFSQQFYELMGSTFYNLARYEEASEYFKKTLNHIPDSILKTSFVKFSRRQAVVNSLGLCYEKSGQDDSALVYYRRALKRIEDYNGYIPENSHFKERARGVVLGNMSGPIYRKGDTAKAQALLKESIAINIRPGYENRDAQTSLIKLAKIYLELNKLKDIEPLLLQLEKSLDSLPDNERRVTWMELNSQYHEKKGDINQAYSYSIKAAELKTSFEEQNIRKRGLGLNKEFEAIEKENEIELLKKRNEQNDIYLLFVSCIALMALIITGLLWYNWKKSKERMLLLTELNDKINVQNTLMERSVKLLDVSQNLSKTGGWEYNYVSGEMFLTKESYQLYGFENNSTPTVEDLREMLRGEDRKLLDIILSSSIRQKLKFQIETEIITKSGEKKWVRIIAEPLHKAGELIGSIGAVQDITQEREAEKNQRNLTAHLQSLISALEDIVFEIDGNKIFRNVWVNDESQLFIEKEKFIGKEIFEVLGPMAKILSDSVDEALKNEIASEIEYKHLDPGIDKWFRAKSVVINKSDNPLRTKLVISVQDITLRKKQDLALKIAKEKLEHSNLEKDRIMQVLVHDLRSPLSGIHSVSSMMLQRNKYPETEHEMLSVINDTSLNLFKMISDLVEISLGNEIGDLKKEKVDLQLLIKQTVLVLQFRANEKKQEIITKIDKKIYALIDAHKIQRVFNNLIGNAIKFSKNNSVITVAGKEENGKIRLSVEDSGIGIPNDLKDNVFNVFTTAKRLGTNNEQPFGLGLSICKQIVEAHDGKIWFESRPEGGTIFFVELDSVIPS